MANTPLLIGALISAAGIAGGAFVDPVGPVRHQEYLSAGAGYYDFRDSADRDSSADLRLEYRSDYVLAQFGLVSIYPFLGVEGTTDGSVYGLAGLQAEVKYDNFYFTPSFGAGAYWSREGKAMGSPLEFRSQAEIGYEFSKAGDRLGVAVSHISNADVTANNPGTEILTLYYHMPLSRLSNW